jgi:type II secretory pathway component PulC
VASDSGRSFAIIEVESTGIQRVCREGDRLGEILVKEILFGKVVIGTNAGDAVLSVGSRVAAGRLVRASQTAPQLARLDREEIDSALPDYAQLAREIRTRPRFEGGRPDGFVIYNIGPESILAQLGLHDGDTIVGVNERPFSTTQPAVEFYDALKEGGIGSVEIKRDDGIRELLFEIR